MFLAANLNEVSEPRATVPKSCFVSENSFVAQASAKHELAVVAITIAAARTRIRMNPNPRMRRPFSSQTFAQFLLQRRSKSRRAFYTHRFNYRPLMGRRERKA